MKPETIKVELFIPKTRVFERDLYKVKTEGVSGSMCILPRHQDFVSVIVPGILLIRDTQGQDEYYAIDAGMMVKFGEKMLISTRAALRGPKLADLHEVVEKEFKKTSQHEQNAQAALKKLEADFVSTMVQWGRE
ncbi:MAG: hypothetical protein GF384_00060 [Elusimicrobia bacterium]|nr:hypothetical protein [Elusimicrobiota bacterium]MBD3411490.1 hypothetical protein [Elusimicrobiota bacterium]